MVSETKLKYIEKKKKIDKELTKRFSKAEHNKTEHNKIEHDIKKQMIKQMIKEVN